MPFEYLQRITVATSPFRNGPGVLQFGDHSFEVSQVGELHRVGSDLGPLIQAIPCHVGQLEDTLLGGLVR